MSADITERPAPAACPACGGEMKPTHIACPWCVTDGALRHGRHLADWTRARTRRVVEAVLWS